MHGAKLQKRWKLAKKKVENLAVRRIMPNFADWNEE